MANEFTYGGNTILSHPIFVETILPFLLVFTIVFAVLQKSKVLGDGKRQIDALVALVIGLLLISFAQATGIILQLIPFLAVSLVIILVFMILVGTFKKDEALSGNWAKFMTALIAVAIVIAVLYVTNAWQFILDFIFLGGDSKIFVNLVFIIIIIGAVIAVAWGAKGDSGKSSS